MSARANLQRNELKNRMTEICIAAGAVILAKGTEGFDCDIKYDESPVTEADREAESLIFEQLKSHFPNIPIIAEEAVSWGSIPETGDLFFLVDPLDGTKEFIAGRKDFTVNIALVEHGVPVYGCVYAPAHQTLYYGDSESAWKRISNVTAPRSVSDFASPQNLRPKPSKNLRVVASRSHLSDETREFIDTLGPCEIVSTGSSLKFCLLAEGAADIYPRFSPTMEWDTAAGDAVLRSTGGITFDQTGNLLAYNDAYPGTPRQFENPYFVALVPHCREQAQFKL